MPFGHKAGLPPSKKYLLMRQPLFLTDSYHKGGAYEKFSEAGRPVHPVRPIYVHRPQGLSCGFPARTEPCFRAVRKRILTGRFPVPYHTVLSIFETAEQASDEYHPQSLPPYTYLPES